jgi:hypothetical protein
MRTGPQRAGRIVLGLILLAGCGEEEKGGEDSIAPAAVTDLSVVSAATNSVELRWTASGDDGSTGTARAYDVRYRTPEITDVTWAVSSTVEGEPSPHASGVAETFTIDGLAPATVYAFALQVIDEKGNASPISNVVAATTLPDEGSDANWWDVFDVAGASDPVYALHVHAGRLIAAGAFTEVGGAAANHVASWDGAIWSPLGAGVSGDVWALATYGDNLAAGGFFTLAGEDVAPYVALWDGGAWSPLGDGMDNAVYALVEWNGQLVAGGEFLRAGGEEAAYLARWDGTLWHAVPGLDDAVYALAVYQGDLIAGGRFLRAGGADVHQIARWDGVAWSGLAGGMFVVPPDPRVVALAAQGAELVAGGHFSIAGDIVVSEVARWDGVSWSPMGSGANDIVLALGTYRGAWIAGGWFDSTGTDPIARVARFDGVGWRPLASGIGGASPAVYAIAEYGGDLYVGGFFETAGGRPSINLARWRD